MLKVIENKIKYLVVVFLVTTFGLLGTAHAAKIANKKISYFNGALIIVVNGTTTSKSGAFTADIQDASGKPYPAMTAEWISASVQMVTMDMGITNASVVDDSPARVKIKANFSMPGQWKLNIKLTTASGSESHSVNFNAP